MGHNELLQTVGGGTAGSAQEVIRLCAEDRHVIADVVHTLAELQPHLDEVNIFAAHFNLLYLRVTERVAEFEALGLYRNPGFLQTLDVHFADRYLGALLAWVRQDGPVPQAWRLVFEPEDQTLAPTQYAALGVNAHINLDLAMALVSTLNHLGITPAFGSAEHHDYLVVNEIFYELIQPLRRVFKGFRTHASLVDALENWMVQVVIDETRDQAWDEASRIWRHQHRAGYLDRREQRLDHAACVLAMPIRSSLWQDILELSSPEELPTLDNELLDGPALGNWVSGANLGLLPRPHDRLARDRAVHVSIS